MEDEFEKDDAYRQATDNEASLAFYSDFINFFKFRKLCNRKTTFKI